MNNAECVIPKRKEVCFVLRQIKLKLSLFTNRTCLLAKDERGDFGIGQIALIVAGVVIVGVVIALVTDRLPTWIDQVWGWITGLIG